MVSPTLKMADAQLDASLHKNLTVEVPHVSTRSTVTSSPLDLYSTVEACRCTLPSTASMLQVST